MEQLVPTTHQPSLNSVNNTKRKNERFLLQEKTELNNQLSLVVQQGLFVLKLVKYKSASIIGCGSANAVEMALRDREERAAREQPRAPRK